jgi:hypothetical protein
MAEDETATVGFHKLSSTQGAKNQKRGGKEPFGYGVDEPSKKKKISKTV